MKTSKEKTLINCNKAHSLICNIISVHEDNRECIDIMQQNLAVIGLLRSAHELLMENHLNTCFLNARSSGSTKKKQEMTEEILKVTNLFNK